MARLMVLEWHREAPEVAEFMQMLREETEWDCFFVWSDGCVRPFGLLDINGVPKPEYFAFQAAATGGTTMSLEQAEQAADWPLGPRWPENPTISEWGNGERCGWYTYGAALEKDGVVYPLLGANRESLAHVAELYGFRLVPA